MNQDLVKVLGVALATAAMGFAGGELTDLTGAKAWKAEQIDEIRQVERLKSRVVALEAQQAILMKLVNEGRCEP